MSNEQALRDALSELIEAYNRAGPGLSRAERAVDRMRLIASHEALALPTADHLPDAGKKVETAEPGGGYVRPVVQARATAAVQRVRDRLRVLGSPMPGQTS